MQCFVFNSKHLGWLKQSNNKLGIEIREKIVQNGKIFRFLPLIVTLANNLSSLKCENILRGYLFVAACFERIFARRLFKLHVCFNLSIVQGPMYNVNVTGRCLQRAGVSCLRL